jgi:predicted transcriptional regulator
LDSERYATLGVLTTIFESPIARLLDQSLLVGNMEQTVSMLAESTNLSYKTVKTGLQKLVRIGFVTPTRKIGNAQAYRFEVSNELHELIECAQHLQIKLLKNESKS